VLVADRRREVAFECGAASKRRRGVAARVLIADAPVSGRDSHVLLLRMLVFEV
jgi:hypothetical protein